MAQRACVRDIAALQDIGDMSYELAEPMLRQIRNPNQLRKIEIASPHIAEHDAELWKAFIRRDIPEWEHKMTDPIDPRAWWKIYRKLIRAEQKAKEESEQQLMAAMQGLRQEREVNKLNIVRKVLSEPTRHAPVFADGILNPYVHSNGVLKRPALKNAKTGRDIMYALRKQTNDKTKQRQLAVSRASQPAAYMVGSARSQITKAPASMIKDHQQRQQLTPAAQQMKIESRPKLAPKGWAGRTAPSKPDKEITEALRAEQAKKEERLRALAAGKSATPTSTQTQTPAPAPSSNKRPAAGMTGAPSSPPSSNKRPHPDTSPLPVSTAAGEANKTTSPSPAPQMIRKRPAPSIFMPSKRRKL